ncbi:MAG: glycosyltransferase [Alphaproteobacteria bacterium]|nr:glycosyltransferase [Alphaproteobacteria bacterium]
MKILHIMAGKGQGGAETYSTDVMLSLHKSGIDQTIVMSSEAPRYEEMKKAGLRLRTAPLALPIRPLQKMLLKNLIAREKPHIIHCWMRRAASLLPTRHDAKAVIGWFGGYYDPKHFGGCEHFVGVTPDIVKHMRDNGVDQTHAHYIPTFPDIETLPPVDRNALATPKDTKVFLTLSRLHPKKGLDTFLKALAQIPDAYAWLAGDGPLRNELEQLAKAEGVMDRVRFLGWRTDRAALLRAADVCVLPSRYEPFGTVILEAWAAGTPFVACKSAGPAATVEDDVNGLLVEIDDIAGLANAMRRATRDEELRRRMVAQGYTAYIKSFTREAVTRQWIQFYQGLIRA